MLHQYFSSRPRISITMPNGKRIYFQAHQHITDKQDEIDFLNSQIQLGHKYIYVKKGAETVTPEQLDPLLELKKKWLAEHEAKQKEQQDPNRDMGNYTSEQKVLTSAGIAQITAPSKGK